MINTEIERLVGQFKASLIRDLVRLVDKDGNVLQIAEIQTRENGSLTIVTKVNKPDASDIPQPTPEDVKKLKERTSMLDRVITKTRAKKRPKNAD